MTHARRCNGFRDLFKKLRVLLWVFAPHKDLESDLAAFQWFQMLCYTKSVCAIDDLIVCGFEYTFLRCRDDVQGIQGEQKQGCGKFIAK